MHSRAMRLGYNKALNFDFNDIVIAPSLVDNDFCQVLWNTRYCETDLLAYYAKFNVSAFKRYIAN